MPTLMDMNEIKNKVIEVVGRNALHNPDRVHEQSNLKNDHGIDSLKIVNLLFDLEEEFGICVDQSSLVFENFSTVEKISQYIYEKLGNADES